MRVPSRASLADRFVWTPQDHEIVHKKTMDYVKLKLRTSARRFVFDTQATSRFAEVVRDVPDLLIREQQFARAPFDVMWLEFDFELFTTIMQNSYDRITQPDKMMGFFIDHGVVYTIASGDAREGASCLPFVYELNTEWSVQDQLKFCGQVKTSRGQLDATFWGGSFSKLDQEAQRRLRQRHTMRVLPLVDHLQKKIDEGILNNMYYQTVGDLRNIVTALLLLNRPSLTTYKEGPRHGSTFIRGKLKPYLAHTVVTINLDPRPTLHLVGTPQDDSTPRRRHEVRGHYCHDARGRSGTCVHEWVVDFKEDDDPQDPDHWKCKVCEGKRWWRNHHERGSALEGFNQHLYAVSTRD